MEDSCKNKLYGYTVTVSGSARPMSASGPVTENCNDRKCYSAIQSDYSDSHSTIPIKNAEQNHKKSDFSSCPDINRTTDSSTTKKDASTMTHGEFAYKNYNCQNFNPYSYSIPPFHLPYQILTEGGYQFAPQFLQNCPQCFHGTTFSKTMQSLNPCFQQCHQPEMNSKNSNKQTEDISTAKNEHEENAIGGSTEQTETKTNNPYQFQNIINHTCCPSCVMSHQNHWCFSPLVVVPSCLFDNHLMYPLHVSSDTQRANQHVEQICSESLKTPVTVNEPHLSSLAAFTNNSIVETLGPPSNTSSNELFTQSIPSQLLYEMSSNTTEQEKMDAVIVQTMVNEDNKSNYKHTISEIKHDPKYKSRIPKSSKLHSSLSSKEKSINTNVSVSNQENNDALLLKIITKQPFPDKLQSYLPHNIKQNKDYPRKSVDEDSGNELKWRVYQSKMKNEPVSSNLLLNTKTEQNSAENSVNIDALEDKNVSNTNKYPDIVQHSRRIDILRDKGITEEKKIMQPFNSGEESPWDWSLSPEIDLDRLAMQLLLTNQEPQDDELIDADEYECTDCIKESDKLLCLPILNKNNNMKVPVSEKEHDKYECNLKSDNVPESKLITYGGSVSNNQPTTAKNNITDFNNVEVCKGGRSIVWQGDVASVRQQFCNQTETGYSEFSNLDLGKENSHSEPDIPVTVSVDNSTSGSAKLIISLQHSMQTSKKSGKIHSDNTCSPNSKFDVLRTKTTQHKNFEGDVNHSNSHEIMETFHKMKRILESERSNSLEKPPYLRNFSVQLPPENENGVLNNPQKTQQLKMLNQRFSQQTNHIQKLHIQNNIWRQKQYRHFQ